MVCPKSGAVMRGLSIGIIVLIVGLLLVALFFLAPNVVTVFLGFSDQLKTWSNLPYFLQNIGLATLGILIPLAVAILTDVLQAKKNKEEADFANLDLHVILDHVFSIRQLVLYAFITFAPFIFWEISFGSLRLLEAIVSLIGICFIVTIILNVYRWTKGNVFSFRLDYLRKLHKPADLEIVWKSVWRSKMDAQSELKFFKIYSSTVTELVKKCEKKH
jgi:hypothetical protein